MIDPSASFIAFMAILNPFALCLYLETVMNELTALEFRRVLLRASGMSWLILTIFVIAGEPLLVRFLAVDAAALQIFGGIIIAIVAYGFVTKGYRSMVMMRGSMDEMPSAIAVPFMVGAGTIMQAILIGERHGMFFGMGMLAAGLTLCYAIVLLYRLIRDRVRRSYECVFDRYVNILARVNGLLVGAIATDMVVSGIHDLWLVA